MFSCRVGDHPGETIPYSTLFSRCCIYQASFHSRDHLPDERFLFVEVVPLQSRGRNEKYFLISQLFTLHTLIHTGEPGHPGKQSNSSFRRIILAWARHRSSRLPGGDSIIIIIIVVDADEDDVVNSHFLPIFFISPD